MLANADGVVHRCLARLAGAARGIEFIADAVASRCVRVEGGVAEAESFWAAEGVVEVKETIGIRTAFERVDQRYDALCQVIGRFVSLVTATPVANTTAFVNRHDAVARLLAGVVYLSSDAYIGVVGVEVVTWGTKT